VIASERRIPIRRVSAGPQSQPAVPDQPSLGSFGPAGDGAPGPSRSNWPADFQTLQQRVFDLANLRNTCSAGFQACCVADFQVGKVSDAAWRQRVEKPAIQQTWKSAPRGQTGAECEIREPRIRAGRTFSTMPRSTSQTSPRLGTLFLLIEHGDCDAGAVGNSTDPNRPYGAHVFAEKTNGLIRFQP